MATFGTKTFFSDVEPFLDAGHRIYHGKDDDIDYVVIDPVFHSLSLFQRNHTLSFTASVLQSLTVNDVALVNGQYFAHNYTYCYVGPDFCMWEGEIIRNGNPIPGYPATAPGMHYIGRERSVALSRYHTGQGDPSKCAPALFHAIGATIPLIVKKIRHGIKNVTAAGVVQRGSEIIAGLEKEDASSGKTVFCLHHASGLIMLAGQENGASGIKWSQMINKLTIMDVDEALALDGSSSACLFVNGTFVYPPSNGLKNSSIPIGIKFTRSPLSLKSFQTPGGTSAAAAVVVTAGSTVLPALTQISGFEATIQPYAQPGLIPPGLMMTVSNFGSAPGIGSGAIAAELNAGTSPQVFVSTTGNLSKPVTFLPVGGSSLSFKLQIDTVPGSDFDTVKGGFSATSPGGAALAGTVSLPVSY